jgi:hypothetical protein
VLEESERRVLDRLLSADFPGVQELRVQAVTVLAQRTCRCGCASIDLVVDASAPMAKVTNTVPVSAHGMLPEPIGAVAVMLFVHKGRLSLMEIASYATTLPTGGQNRRISPSTTPTSAERLVHARTCR